MIGVCATHVHGQRQRGISSLGLKGPVYVGLIRNIGDLKGDKSGRGRGN